MSAVTTAIRMRTEQALSLVFHPLVASPSVRPSIGRRTKADKLLQRKSEESLAPETGSPPRVRRQAHMQTEVHKGARVRESVESRAQSRRAAARSARPAACQLHARRVRSAALRRDFSVRGLGHVRRHVEISTVIYVTTRHR